MAPYPSVARMSWGFRDTTDGECIGTGTQRNRRSDRIKVVKTTNDKVSPVRQSGQGVLPHACWLESASNLTNPGLGETGETYRRNHVRILQDVVRPSQTTSGGAPKGVRVEAQPVIRLSEEIQGWMSEMKVIKNEEEK